MLFTFHQFDSVCKRNRQPNERLAISNIKHRINMSDAADSIVGGSRKVKLGRNRSGRSGLRFGRLVTVSFYDIKNRNARWECLCDCGQTSIVHWCNLKCGKTLSCGCLQSEAAKKAHTKHGEASKNTREYGTWRSMRARCLNPKATKYPRYGGRGITICDRWMNSYACFLADMGRCPKGMTLERKNVNGNYEPGNCCWATPSEQANNKTNNRVLVHDGVQQTHAQWERQMGYSQGLIASRMRKGWSSELALTTPLKFSKP